jgi:hypothetical protein
MLLSQAHIGFEAALLCMDTRIHTRRRCSIRFLSFSAFELCRLEDFRNGAAAECAGISTGARKASSDARNIAHAIRVAFKSPYRWREFSVIHLDK